MPRPYRPDFALLLLLLLPVAASAQGVVVNLGAGVKPYSLGPGVAVAMGPTGAGLVGINYVTGATSWQPLTGPATDIRARRISDNGQWVVGFGQTAGASLNDNEGLIWSAADPANPHLSGFVQLPPGNYRSTSLGGVSDAGRAVGTSSGALTAVHWTAAAGIQAYPAPTDGAVATDVNRNGTVAVGFALVPPVTTLSPVQASVWTAAGHRYLNDPYLVGSAAFGLSPNGVRAVGHISHLDFDTFATHTLPAVWSIATGALTEVTAPGGVLIDGLFRDATDTGWAVGESNDGNFGPALRGLIYHPSLGGVRYADDWLVERGITLPEPSVAVYDVRQDGDTLFLAVEGATGGYAVAVSLTPVPEPAVPLLLVAAAAGAWGQWGRRGRSAAGCGSG